MSRWRTVTFTRVRPGSSGARKVTAWLCIPAKAPGPSRICHWNVRSCSTRRRERSRDRARSSLASPIRTMADAGETVTLKSGPANSKNCRCRSSPSAGSAAPRTTPLTSCESEGEFATVAPSSIDRNVRAWMSNQSYSSAGNASSASRNARWIVRSCSWVACSSSARRCSSMTSTSFRSSGCSASHSVAYAVSWTRPERVPGVRLTNGASTWPCRQRKVLDHACAVPEQCHAIAVGRLAEIQLGIDVADPCAQCRQLMQQPALVLAWLDGVLLTREPVDDVDPDAGLPDTVAQLRREIPLDLFSRQTADAIEQRRDPYFRAAVTE